MSDVFVSGDVASPAGGKKNKNKRLNLAAHPLSKKRVAEMMSDTLESSMAKPIDETNK